jgi:hypothetical protein
MLSIELKYYLTSHYRGLGPMPGDFFEICSGQNGTGVVFALNFFGFLLISIISPLLHTHLSLFSEMWNSPDQVSHYVISHPWLLSFGALSPSFDWPQKKVVGLVY